MSTDILVIQPTDIPAILSDKEKLLSMLERVKKAALAEVPDVATKQGRAEITSMAAKVARMKAPVKAVATEMKAEAQATINTINGLYKVWDEGMVELKAQVAAPLEEYKAAEEKRVAALQDRLKLALEFEPANTSKEIEFEIERVKGVSTDQDIWEEFAGAAQVAKKQMLAKLRDKLDLVVEREAAEKQAEADRAELAALRAKQAEEQAEREAAEAKAKADAEAAAEKQRLEQQAEIEALRAAQAEKDAEAAAALKAMQDKADAEREAAQAVLRAQQEEREAEIAAIRAENERLAKIEAERKAQAEREAAKEAEDKAKRQNKKRIADARQAAIDAFYQNDATQEFAETIVDLIIGNKIPNILFVPE